MKAGLCYHELTLDERTVMAVIHVDVPKVRGKMAEKGYNLTSLSEKLEISRNTMASYLENPGKIPYSTISKLASILCDDNDEAANIFFAADLRKT